MKNRCLIVRLFSFSILLTLVLSSITNASEMESSKEVVNPQITLAKELQKRFSEPLKNRYSSFFGYWVAYTNFLSSSHSNSVIGSNTDTTAINNSRPGYPLLSEGKYFVNTMEDQTLEAMNITATMALDEDERIIVLECCLKVPLCQDT